MSIKIDPAYRLECQRIERMLRQIPDIIISTEENSMRMDMIDSNADVDSWLTTTGISISNKNGSYIQYLCIYSEWGYERGCYRMKLKRKNEQYVTYVEEPFPLITYIEVSPDQIFKMLTDLEYYREFDLK